MIVIVLNEIMALWRLCDETLLSLLFGDVVKMTVREASLHLDLQLGVLALDIAPLLRKEKRRGSLRRIDRVLVGSYLHDTAGSLVAIAFIQSHYTLLSLLLDDLHLFLL